MAVITGSSDSPISVGEYCRPDGFLAHDFTVDVLVLL
jgi:hypothetical protein